jgi:hypothetical protein
VELVDHAGRADLHDQAGFLVELARRLSGRLAWGSTPPPGAQRRSLRWPGIGVHKEQAVLDQKDAANGERGIGRCGLAGRVMAQIDLT